ncbi:MAG: divergent PAP2 family protein [Oscillospiraceae bacterium]|nr:divergent PAP2 family protein [Oscillospiraceae bacterium]
MLDGIGDFFVKVIDNKAITVPALAWLVAQTLKVAVESVRHRGFSVAKCLKGSGGMPSAHTAYIVSLATVIGRVRGWDNLEFGLAVAIAIIIMYDAAGVRRAAGQHAEVLNRMSGGNGAEDKRLNEYMGHKPIEVAVGAVLGIALAMALT